MSLDDEEPEPVEKNETETTTEPEPTSTFVPPTQSAAKVVKKEEVKEEEEKDPRKRFGWRPPKKVRKRKVANLPVILALKKISRSGKVRIQFNQKLKIPRKFRRRQRRKLGKGSDSIFKISMKNKEGEIHSFKHDITGWDEGGIDI